MAFHFVTLYLQHTLVQVFLEKKSYAEAEKLGRETLEARRKALQAGNQDIGQSLLVLGRVFAEQEKFGQARPLLEEAAKLFRQNYGHRKDSIAYAENWLGACLAAGKEFLEAEQLLESSYEMLKTSPSVPKRYKETARQHVIQLYESWDKPEKAAAWRAKP